MAAGRCSASTRRKSLARSGVHACNALSEHRSGDGVAKAAGFEQPQDDARYSWWVGRSRDRRPTTVARTARIRVRDGASQRVCARVPPTNIPYLVGSLRYSVICGKTPSLLPIYTSIHRSTTTWTEEKCRFLTEKNLRLSLPSGGRIVIHELLLDSEKAGPRLPALMGMVMLLWTEGRQYSGLELSQLLELVGFIGVHTEQTLGSWGIVTGVKP